MKASWLTAAGVTVALALWMASGLLRDDGGDVDGEPANAAEAVTAPMRVRVRIAEPAAEERRVRLRGQVAAVRTVTVRAETAGRVLELPARRGLRVEANAALATLNAGVRAAAVAGAKASLASAAAERTAALDLGRRGLQARLQIEQSAAAESLARAELDRLERDLEDTRIRAPFAAVVESVPAEIGQLVERGDPIATLVDDSAFDVTARAAQQVAAELEPGQRVDVELITGETLVAELVWVASVADPATRSFEIEARIDEPRGALAAGVSATLSIPVEEVEALYLSPSTFTLGEDGDLGVKLVDDDERVTFRPVSLLRTSLDGAWVTGIPAGARIVTLGQGFVGVGERVLASVETDDETDTDAEAMSDADPSEAISEIVPGADQEVDPDETPGSSIPR